MLVTLLLSFVPVAGRSAAAAGAATLNAPNQYYLALGDSLAYGYQQYKFTAEYPNIIPSTFNTGYVDDFAALLATVHPEITTVNFGCPGETTGSFLSGHCQVPDAFLHNSYNGAPSQLQAALAFLQAHPGQVNPITIDIGANDMVVPIESCFSAPNQQACLLKLTPLILQAATNIRSILSQLRAAAPDSEIIVMQYYNPFAAVTPPTTTFANWFVELANAAIGVVALQQRARLADAFPPFNLAQPQPQTLCTLTLFCTALHDIHPSDTGYSVIAKLFWAASGYGHLNN